MTIDTAKRRLLIGCRKPQKLIIMSTDTGKVLADLPIGDHVDAVKLDGGQIFASCADGTLAVVSETSPAKFAVVETVKTPKGARTMGVDSTTHRIYLPTAELPGGTPNRKSPAISLSPSWRGLSFSITLSCLPDLICSLTMRVRPRDPRIRNRQVIATAGRRSTDNSVKSSGFPVSLLDPCSLLPAAAAWRSRCPPRGWGLQDLVVVNSTIAASTLPFSFLYSALAVGFLMIAGLGFQNSGDASATSCGGLLISGR